MLLGIVENMAVKHRRTLGDRIMDSAYNCVDYLHFAYGSKDERRYYQDKFKMELSRLKTYLRVANEGRYIPLKKATLIAELCENISRQLAGWTKATKATSERPAG
jgi:hypothetical protein